MSASKNYSISFVANVFRDDAVASSTLMRSSLFPRKVSICLLEDHPTVAHAYEYALNSIDSEILVFTHPDVYFPDAWLTELHASLDWLEKNDPNWGILGLYGTKANGKGMGFLYSTGRKNFVGDPFAQPEQVRTLDEFVFILKKKNEFYFDTNIPNGQFQLGATDLCLQAESRGMRNYSIPCFAIHNSNRWNALPLSFWRTYLYIRKKWRQSLPIKLPYANITSDCMPMLKSSITYLRNQKNMREETRIADPVHLYQLLLSSDKLVVLKDKAPA